MSHSGATEAIDRILDAGGEADEVLQAVVDVLHDRFDHYSWIGIYLVEGDALVLVDLDERRACPVPDWYREQIAAFEGDDLA